MNRSDRRAEKILTVALQIHAAAQRQAYVDGACGGDDALHREVESLLHAAEQAGSLLEEMATNVVDRPNEMAAPAPLAEKPGDRIGRYKLLEQIGEGGMGAVWMAEQDEPVRRRVALKIIKLGMDTRDVVARFEAERQALALMDHPNIARVFDGGASGSGRPYFVMELVRGVPFTNYCDEAKLTTRERLVLFNQVCQAVQHAHQKGIIHRDLKPSNILVALHDGVPVPKVIDFGIAKATDQRLTDKTLFTHFQEFLGTPAYTSPEQAEMGALDIDTRTDIYSLGVLLYKLLTGTTPFETKELLEQGLDEMRRTIREKEPPRPSTRLSRLEMAELTTTAQRRRTEAPKLIALLRGDLDWIVMKCLEKDRTRRYETANGLAADLRRYLNSEPVLARPPSKVYRLRKLVHRNKLAFAAAGIVFVALLGALGVSIYSLAEERSARSRAEIAERAQSQLRQDAESAREGEKRERLRAEQRELTTRQQLYVVDMNLAQLALQADDRQRAHMLLERNAPQPGQQDLRGWEWRYLWQAARSEELFTLGYHSNVVTCLAVSPNGKLLLSGSYDDSVMLWDVEGRRQMAALPIGSTVNCVAFSPDGTLFASGDAAGVKLWNTDRLEVVATMQPGGRIRAAAFSPDGKRLAAYSSGRITVWNTTTRDEELAFPVDKLDGSLRGAVAFSPDGELLAVGEAAGHIHLFDSRTGRGRYDLPGHRGSITGLAFIPGGKGLISSSWDSTARLWDLESRSAKFTFSNHTTWATSPTLSPDGRLLATASADQTVNVWDVATGRLTATLRGHQGEVWAAVFLPDGQRLASGGKDDAIKLWKVTQRGADETRLPDFRTWQFSSDGKTIAVQNSDFAVGILDVQTTNGFLVLLDQQAPITALRFSPDGKSLATGDSTGLVQLWDPKTRRQVRRLARHDAGIQRVNFSAKGDSLCSLDSRGSYQRTEPATGMEIASGQIPVVRNRAVAFSPDHKFVAIARSSAVILLDLASGSEVSAFRGHRETLRDLAFSPDGRWLASASEDATVRVWDMAARTHVALLRGHRNGAYSLDFSPDSRRLVSGGGEGLIKLWDTATWQEVATLESARKVDPIFFSPDGHTLVGKSDRGGWTAWRAPAFDEIAAEAGSGRSFSDRLATASVESLPPVVPRRPATNPPPLELSQPGRVFIPPRHPEAATKHIDLSPFYNVGLTNRWAPSANTNRLSTKTLSALTPGLQLLDGVHFDARGLVQLQSTTFLQRGLFYPVSITNIPIRHPCASLHFLHATSWDEADGNTVGHYEVQFEDGESTRIPIVYGRDVRNWDSWGDRSTYLSAATIGWQGTNLMQTVDGRRPFVARLFKTSWANPRPGVAIRSLDFRSALTTAGPFLVAVTAE